MITKTEKQVAAFFVILVALAAIAFFVLPDAAYGQGKPESPPGQGECAHGNSQKPCKDDPQPDKGKDCEEHGPKEGGVNEDHCKGTTEPPVDPPCTVNCNPVPPVDPPKEDPPSTPEEPDHPIIPTCEQVPTICPVTPEAPASPVSPSPSAPEAPAAPSVDQPTLEKELEQQAKKNGATSSPGNLTPATDTLPHTGLGLWLATAFGLLALAGGTFLRGDLTRMARMYGRRFGR